MCLIDYADDSCWTYLDHHEVTARKEHRCCECWRTIAKGERYERASGISDGAFCYFKTCAHCIATRPWLDRNCGGWVFGGIAEDLREHTHPWVENPDPETSAVRELVAAIGEQWAGWTPEHVSTVAVVRQQPTP